MKIFLIGLLGSGKSFLGRQLSGLMGLPFIDLDQAIEATEGAKVSEIFSAKGETYFRKIEAAALRKQSKKREFIMATGGGAPCFHDNMTFINQAGTSIFLNIPVAEIAKRLKGTEHKSRPLLVGVPEDELPAKLNSMLEDRLQFYSKAHIHVSGATISAEEIQNLIKSKR